MAEQHARLARACARLELAQQPRLADAGLTADEDESRPPGGGAVERDAQRVELRLAADERCGGHAACHALHCRAVGAAETPAQHGRLRGRGAVHRARRDTAPALPSAWASVPGAARGGIPCAATTRAASLASGRRERADAASRSRVAAAWRLRSASVARMIWSEPCMGSLPSGVAASSTYS